MNIFEELGILNRTTNKVTQLVKHWDEVSDKYKKLSQYYVTVKKDGVHAMVLVEDKNVKIFSRTGKQLTNVEHLIEDFTSAEIPNGVYMGEITCDPFSLEGLSGNINPNRVKTGNKVISATLELHLFDLVSIEEFKKGLAYTPYIERVSDLEDIVSDSTLMDTFVIDPVLLNTEDITKYFDECVVKGEEGIVIRNPSAPWTAGHKNWHAMKMVRGVSFDLLCIGIEEGTGKYTGKAANLIFKWENETIKCMLGKGWGHNEAEYFFKNPPIGEIFEVYALDISSKGKLRLPKVGEHRHDKLSADK